MLNKRKTNLLQTYKKVIVNRPGRDFRAAIDIVEVPFPTLEPQQILVRNLFAGVNASDVNISAGVYFMDIPLPWDTGVEATGEVVAVGSAVEHLQVGDHVLTTLIGGGYREYFALDASMAIPIPQASAEITAIAVGALSASMALEVGGNMTSGETVLITAAAGGVGHFAVQLAKQAGNHVIGTTSTAAKAELLTELGCDRVINYREDDIDAILKGEYPQGVDLVLDGVGGDLFDALVPNIARRGRIVVIGFIAEYHGNPQVITAPRLYHQLLWKSAMVRGFLYSDYVPQIPHYMGKLMTLFAEGGLHAEIDPTPFVGIEAIPDAVEHLQNGKNAGKVIVQF